MTFREKFDELKAEYGPGADFSGADCDFAAQIRLTDPDCHGTFYVAYLGGDAAIEPYDYRDHTVDIEIESRLLRSILDGEPDPTAAFLNGEFQLDGDADHALALIGALKKKPKKKTNRKKPE